MFTLVTIVILCYFLVVIFVFFYQRNLLYHPLENNYSSDEANFEYEEVFVPTSEGKELKAWFHKKDLREKKTLLFFHGNAGDLKNRIYILILIKDLLADDGSIFVHCDWRLNSHLRLVMNEIFGIDQFRNEIIWCYSGPGKNDKGFVKKHDSIIYYSKSYLHNHNVQRIKHKSGIHNTGKFLGKINEVKGLKEQLESSGKRLEDWWTDIFTADRVRTERVGYPTQKPENLLRRIIDSLQKREI